MDTEAEANGAEERIALAAEAATRSSAAALLEKQQLIPVKEDYFLPADEVAAGAQSCARLLWRTFGAFKLLCVL